MRSVSTLFATAATALLLCNTGHAADSEGNYAVWGMGNQSCHAYNKARANDESDPFKYYVMGYLTAYNVHQSETYSISATQPMPDIMSWMDEFCDNHAVSSFEHALKNFIHEHYEERMDMAPQKFGR